MNNEETLVAALERVKFDHEEIHDLRPSTLMVIDAALALARVDEPIERPERMISDERLAALNAEGLAMDEIERATNEVHDRLERAFGGLLNLPYVAIDEPKWLDAGYKEDRQMQRKLELAGLDRITQAGRIRYHEQLREGQGYDDGCGFKLRCWMAALRYPFQPAWSSRSAVRSDAHVTTKIIRNAKVQS